MYFESEDGGMDVHEGITGPDYFTQRRLYGWMNDDVRAEDMALLEWMETAEVGDHHYHRLGVMVRLRDG